MNEMSAIASAIEQIASMNESMAETNLPTIVIKTTTGDSANGKSGQIVINTFDNSIKMYADGGWRTLASW